MAGQTAAVGLDGLDAEVMRESVYRAVEREHPGRAKREMEEFLFEKEETPQLRVVREAIEDEEWDRARGAIEVLLAGTFYDPHKDGDAS